MNNKIYKQYSPNSYYHIYSRGNNKSTIFHSDEDKSAFLQLFKRYLSETPQLTPDRHLYPTYYSQIELLTYALMPNHFHLLIYQADNPRAIEQFMRSLMTSYSKYFNKTHNRTGPVFQSRYLAKLIDNDAHLYHISRYIHLNPTNWQSGHDTSLSYYSGQKHANWINPGKILDLFPTYDAYLKFLSNYDPSTDKQFPDIELND